MISSSGYKEAYVWIWLPGETEPVVAGRLEADNGRILFNYGRSYLERVNDSRPAIPITEALSLSHPERCSIMSGIWRHYD